jgi:hypothetical protein
VLWLQASPFTPFILLYEVALQDVHQDLVVSIQISTASTHMSLLLH